MYPHANFNPITRFACIAAFILLNCCSPVNPITSYKGKTHPQYIITPRPKKFLLINAYNVAEKKYRDNKQELFKKVLDSVLVVSATEILEREQIPAEFVRGYTSITANEDSSILSRLKTHNATHCIVIDSFDVRFEQTHVEVTKSQSGKSREADYDIISEIGFKMFSEQGLYKQALMKEQRYHSTRNVVSGLLAAGPNIVSQRNEAWKVTLANTVKYLDQFFEGR